VRVSCLSAVLWILMAATSAWADVAPVPHASSGWPAWVVVLLGFAAFLLLVVILAKFLGKNREPGRGGPDDAAPGL